MVTDAKEMGYHEHPHLAQLEIEARDAKRGLWQDPKPIPLWVFCKRQRGLSVSRDEMSCFPIVPAPREGVQLPSQPEPQELVLLPVAGNIRSARTICPTVQAIARATWKIT